MKNFKAHILVVDDDDGIRNLVKQYLNENNFLVTTAKDAEDAKEKVSIIKFDIIVLDINNQIKRPIIPITTMHMRMIYVRIVTTQC